MKSPSLFSVFFILTPLGILYYTKVRLRRNVVHSPHALFKGIPDWFVQYESRCEFGFYDKQIQDFADFEWEKRKKIRNFNRAKRMFIRSAFLKPAIA